MRDAQKSYIVVGIFVLVMLGALVGWLAVLTGRTGTTEAYYIEYENVMGLTEGAQILYGGYRVGQIEGISPALVLIDPPGRSSEPRRTARTTWSKVRPWRRSDSSGTSIEIS